MQKPREDGAGDEVGREDRRVPAGQDGDREVGGDDGVHRQDERRRQSAEQAVGHAVVALMARRAAPAEREDAVDVALPACRRAVAHRREIGNEAEVPEEQRDGEVGRDRGHVPRQRALEVGPHLHRRGIGHEPVGEPRAAEVEERKESRLHDREQRHRLGEAVDRGAPFLLEEQEDRGDERAGVADPDPPDEVGDGERPGDGDVVAPHADACRRTCRRSRPSEHERCRRR